MALDPETCGENQHGFVFLCVSSISIEFFSVLLEMFVCFNSAETQKDKGFCCLERLILGTLS